MPFRKTKGQPTGWTGIFSCFNRQNFYNLNLSDHPSKKLTNYSRLGLGKELIKVGSGMPLQTQGTALKGFPHSFVWPKGLSPDTLG